MLKNKRKFLIVVAVWSFVLPVVFALLVHFVFSFRLLPLSCLKMIPVRPTDLIKRNEIEVVDRRGVILRHVPASDGTRSLPVTLKRVPLMVSRAFLAAEDKRFFSHCGYDLIAIFRAMWFNLCAGHIVSGASTITQQLVRMSHPRPRSFYSKAVELICAVKIEHLLSKRQILERYLNHVPMGNNIRGIGLAARCYFDVPVSGLSASQAALLAALPQSPGRITSRTGRIVLEKRRLTILKRMLQLGYLDSKSFAEAVRERPAPLHPHHPFKAVHVVEMALKSKSPMDGRIRLTIDYDVQSLCEQIVASRRVVLAGRNCSQVAVVVLNNKSLDVLALVGSSGIDVSPDGWNNGALAWRSAGSTLKPFAYGLALERGWTASSMLRDTRRTYATPLSDYRPLNFSRTEHGPVLLRQALACSLNLPAVHLMMKLGVGHFLQRLKQLGLRPLVDNADHYGLGLVLGNMEVRLIDLAAAYATLSNNGQWKAPRIFLDKKQAVRKVMTEQSAFIITNILSDSSARIMAFGTPWFLDYPWPVALKTGTSTSYRDTWMVAYTTRNTVAVWAGNFNGAPTAEMTGASACGPVVHDIIEGLVQRFGPPADFKEPDGIIGVKVCSVSGALPGVNCPHTKEELFMDDNVPQAICQVHKSKKPGLVYLPTEYAPWAGKQDAQGLLGRYRLCGERELPQVGIRKYTIDSHDPMMVVTGIVNIEAKTFPVASWPEGPCRVQILSPLPVDKYIFDPRRSAETQKIRLQVEVSRPVEHISWFIDGSLYARVPVPYDVFWSLARGEHRIVAACPDGTADSVTIFVN